jgi:hypothetical protein
MQNSFELTNTPEEAALLFPITCKRDPAVAPTAMSWLT